jgi:hypothetical protein
MGSVSKAAGGVAAAMLIQAGMAAAASVANAQPIVPVPCSSAQLVSAITSANMVGGRILRLAPRCNYLLTSAADIGATGPDGLPIIRGNIALIGGPSTRITRPATAPAFRLIEVAQGGSLRVRNIFLIGGNATTSGGAIRNSGGTVELSHTTVFRNRAQTFGGGLDNVGPDGRMVVNTSLIADNTAATINGGGIFNDGSLSVNFSRLTRNNAAAGSGGGLRNTGGGRANIFRSTLDHNTVAVNGGGASNGPGSTLTRSRDLIVHNRATTGGGVFNEPGGTLNLTASVIRHNNPNNCVGTGCA